MKKTRRYKYLQISVFFLIYSIIHVVSVSNSDNDKKEDTPKSAFIGPKNEPKTDKQSQAEAEHHRHLQEKVMQHVHQTFGIPNPNTKNKNSGSTPSSTKLDNNNDNKIETEQTTDHLESTDGDDNTADHHKHTVGAVFKQLHGALGGKKEKNNTNNHEHTAQTVAKHVEGSIGSQNISKNSTVHQEHAAGSVIKHLGGVFPAGKSSDNVTEKKEEDCIQPAIRQFPHPIMSPYARRHGGLIIHVLVAVYMFLGLAIVCDEYFVASLDRICEELKMSPDVAGATFMAAGSSAPELATVIIGVFLAQDDIGISGVIGSAVFNIMFVISCCGLCSSVVIYLNWWPLVRDCFFYAVSVLVMLGVIYDEKITWVESVILLVTYVIYCIVLHYNTPLEAYAYTLPVPFRHVAPTEQSGLVSYKTLDDDGKLPNYGMDWSPEKQPENPDQGLNNFGAEWSPERNQQAFTNQLSGPALNQATMEPPPQPPAPSKPIQQDYYKPKEYDPSTQVNPLIKPEGAGLFAQITWAIVYPIHLLCRYTTPDCRSEKYRNWYPFTFFMSMFWISFYSYFMVWMITLIGFTLTIPDTVMGLTFVAAGVSVPDALSSVAVIKEGYGDMAVSNAVGSNVFDILVCLGLPWFIKTAMVNPGSVVRVKSKGLTYSTLSLLSTVVFLVVATHMNGWKLDRRYGIILMIWYLIFIAFASMYELNVFGQLNPKTCELTDW